MPGRAVSSFTDDYLAETKSILDAIDRQEVERVAQGLADVRQGGGRLFILGVGGSAPTASHLVADIRKACGFEAYAPTDNVSELTARINDDGWASTFSEWLKGSRLKRDDALLVFSVGGGDRARNISPNLVSALELARETGARVFGVVGRDGGATREAATACVVIPPLITERVTPHTEGISSVVAHLLITHPALRRHSTKWESVAAPAKP